MYRRNENRCVLNELKLQLKLIRWMFDFAGIQNFEFTQCDLITIFQERN